MTDECGNLDAQSYRECPARPEQRSDNTKPVFALQNAPTLENRGRVPIAGNRVILQLREPP
jgi:hypothetical protein